MFDEFYICLWVLGVLVGLKLRRVIKAESPQLYKDIFITPKKLESDLKSMKFVFKRNKRLAHGVRINNWADIMLLFLVMIFGAPFLNIFLHNI